MAKTADKTIEEVVQGGPALAFVVFPDAVANMEGSQLWSFLFFFMLITLGLDSMFTLVETVTTALMDHFKSLREYKPWVVVGSCAAGFLLGIPMTCSAGIYLFTLIDETSASWNILAFAFLEVTTVAWLYGTDRFLMNIEDMGIQLPLFAKVYWSACWTVVTPVILAILVVAKFITYSPVAYAKVPFPESVQVAGWIIGASSCVLIPAVLVRQVLKRKKAGKPLGWALLKPTPKWLPQGNKS